MVVEQLEKEIVSSFGEMQMSLVPKRMSFSVNEAGVSFVMMPRFVGEYCESLEGQLTALCQKYPELKEYREGIIDDLNIAIGENKLICALDGYNLLSPISVDVERYSNRSYGASYLFRYGNKEELFAGFGDSVENTVGNLLKAMLYRRNHRLDDIEVNIALRNLIRDY